jgi:hypothetical protein
VEALVDECKSEGDREEVWATVGKRQPGSPNPKFANGTNASIAEFVRKNQIKDFEKNFGEISDDLRVMINNAIPKVQDDGLL